MVGMGGNISPVFGGGSMGSAPYTVKNQFGTGIANMPDVNAMATQRRQFDVQQAGETQRANIAANAQMFPAKLAQERFNTVFPWLQGKLGSASGAQGSGSELGNGAQPRISTSPVWNPQQIQQQVNQSNAASDASTQSQQRQLSNSLGGLGYGAGSPLAQALSAGMGNANLQSKTGNETNLRLNAQQQNAQQMFGEQQAASNQYSQRQQEALQGKQILASQSNALLAALASMSH